MLPVVAVVGWSFVGIVKVVAAHHLRESVRMRQHVRDGLLVVARVLVRDDVAGAAVAALVVVIVDEDEGAVVASHAPAVVDEAAQLTVIVDAPSQFLTVAEFRHQTFRYIN